MAESLLDLPPSEALIRTQAAAGTGAFDALPALDGYFRNAVLSFLQDRAFPMDEIRPALLEAVLWARQEGHSPWHERWAFLLELLRDGENRPALAGELRSLQGTADLPPAGRAAELLAALIAARKPLRPSEISQHLGISQQHVANLAARLEEGGLIARRVAEGEKATWLLPTARGFQLAALLPAPPEVREDVVGPRPTKQVGAGGVDLVPPSIFWRPTPKPQI